MSDLPPRSIAANPDFDTVVDDAQRNLDERKAAADVVNNRTEGVYDSRNGSIVQVPFNEAEQLRSEGEVTVGDRESLDKQAYDSIPGRAATYLNSALNTASFGTYNHLLRAIDPELLTTQNKLEQENPKIALAGTVFGGAGTGELRALSFANKGLLATQIGLSAYEGASNTYNDAKALKEPITSEQLLMGAGYGMLYSALFNAGLHVGAKALGSGIAGGKALNDKYGLFKSVVDESGGRPRPGSGPVSESGGGFNPDSDPTVRPKGNPAPPPASAPTGAPEYDSTWVEGNQKATKPKNKPTVGNIHTFTDSAEAPEPTTPTGMVPYKGGISPTEGPLDAHEIHDSSDWADFVKRGKENTHNPKPGTETELDQRIESASTSPEKLQALKKENRDIYGPASRARNEVVIPDDVKASDVPEFVRLGREVAEGQRRDLRIEKFLRDIEKHGPFTDVEPVPYENPAPGEIHPAMKNMVDGIKHDPGALHEHFAEAEKRWHKSLIDLDKAEPGSPDHARLETEAAQYHHAVNEIQEALAKHEPEIKPPPEPHAGREVEWVYPEDATDYQKKRHVGKYYNRLLGDEGQKAQAVYLELKQQLMDAKTPGQKARIHLKIQAVEKELHLQFPRSVHAETGDIKPGWRDTQREYARLHGNEHIDPDMLKFRRATPEEKQSIEADAATSADQPGMGVSGDSEELPNPYEDLVPGNAKEAAAQGREPVPNGPSRPNTRHRYVPRFSRWDLWRARAFSGPFRPLVHTVAVANELGPWVLNNGDRFASGMVKLAEASNGRLGKAIKGAITGKMSQDASSDVVGVDAHFRQTQKMIAAAQSNPQSLEAGIRAVLGPGADDHPEFVSNTVAATSRAVSAIGARMSRNPNLPTPRNSEYDPPRSEKVRINNLTRAVFDPASVIRNPDPDTWEAVKQVHPQTAKFVIDTLLSVVSNPKIKLNRAQARNLSILIGGPVTPQNEPDFIKGMHTAASMMQAAKPPGSPGGQGGPSQGNAKVSQQIIALTATPDQQAQLGL